MPPLEASDTAVQSSQSIVGKRIVESRIRHSMVNPSLLEATALDGANADSEEV